LCEGADSAAEAEHQLNFYAACDDVDTQTLSTVSAGLMMTPPEVDFTRAPPMNSADHGLLSTTTTTATRPTAIAAAVVPDNDSAVRVDVTESSQYEAEFAVGAAAVSRGTDDEHASTPSRQLQQQTAATSDTEVERSSVVDQLVRVFSVSRAPAACACYTHADQQRASNASILTRHQLSTLPTHEEQLELPAVDLETNAQPHDASSAIITTTPPASCLGLQAPPHAPSPAYSGAGSRDPGDVIAAPLEHLPAGLHGNEPVTSSSAANSSSNDVVDVTTPDGCIRASGDVTMTSEVAAAVGDGGGVQVVSDMSLPTAAADDDQQLLYADHPHCASPGINLCVAINQSFSRSFVKAEVK